MGEHRTRAAREVGARVSSAPVGPCGHQGARVLAQMSAAAVPARFEIDTPGFGEDAGAPPANSHDPPFVFTGTINRVVIDLN